MWTTRSRALEFFAFGFVLSLLAAAIGIWLGLAVLWPPRAAQLPGLDQLSAVTQSRESENGALRARIESLQGDLKGNVCQLDPKKLAPLGTVNKQAAVPPDAVPPAANGQKFKGSLAQLLDQATVLILALNDKGLEEGSGFFISQNQIVTNRHVIADASPGKIFVFNTAFGKPLQAQVLATTPGSKIGSPDFAVLQVDAQAAVQPLALSASVEQLEPVVAAGYPGLEVSNDQQFQALLHGNGAAAPSVVLTDGRISAIQTSEAGTKILPHTAEIAPGNSGGPLVDQCGRVIGVDTFLVAESDQAVHLNYALQATALAAFLSSKQITATESDTPCTNALPDSGP